MQGKYKIKTFLFSTNATSETKELLKENGVVLFLDRPLEQLITTPDRPLSSNKELLKKRFEERYEIYCDVCDKRIDASQSLEENIKRTKEVFLNENFSS